MGLLPPAPETMLGHSSGRGPQQRTWETICLCSVCSVRAAHSEAEGLELCQPQAALCLWQAAEWGRGAAALPPSPTT